MVMWTLSLSTLVALSLLSEAQPPASYRTAVLGGARVVRNQVTTFDWVRGLNLLGHRRLGVVFHQKSPTAGWEKGDVYDNFESGKQPNKLQL